VDGDSNVELISNIGGYIRFVEKETPLLITPPYYDRLRCPLQ